MPEASDHTGSTPMFAIFVLSLYSLYLIPYTIYKLCGGSSEENVSKSWESKKSKGVSPVDRIKTLIRNPLFIQWVVYILLFWYTSSRASAVQQFDPFQILQVPTTAGDAEIKKAYRRLSLQYHPDKNPDPEAADYFANYISKAYQALTDEVSRENYKKYGHPDGPQAFTVSVALPEWFFSKDKNNAPLILLGLLFGGIVLPIALAAYYLTKRDKFTGPNQLMHETVLIFAHDPRIGIKESQSLTRIPETVVCAMEFITLPSSPGQAAALDELRKRIISLYPDLKSKAAFWKRRAGVVKAHMLLLAHLERQPIPPALQKDYQFVLQKLPPLLREMIGISCAPRVQPGYGWLSPALGSLEMLQHVVRAVPIDARKGGKGSGESTAALLQLPGLNNGVLKALTKKKLRNPQELLGVSGGCAAILRDVGLSEEESVKAETALAAMPRLFASLEARDELGERVEPEKAVLGGEVITLRVSLALTRAAHGAPGFDPDTIRGTRVAAYAPDFPVAKDEAWYFVLGDPGSNAAMSLRHTSLVQAEICGARAFLNARKKTEKLDLATFDPLAVFSSLLASNAKESSEDSSNFEEAEEFSPDSLVPEPQEVELMFRAPIKAGRYNLTLHCMSDSWIGCDRNVSFKLKVVEPTRAQLEGRAARSAELTAAEDSWEEVGSSEADEPGSEGEEEGEYDSDEYGTEESSDEEEESSKDDRRR